MASIERTAYPRFKRSPSAHDLNELHTPTKKEIAFARKFARSETHLLALVVLLKSFQRLGYFPKLEDVPPASVSHLRSYLHLKPEVGPGYEEARTLYRHHRAIRDFLSVKAYGKEARHLAILAVYMAAQTMDNPADLINVALETLVKERCELAGLQHAGSVGAARARRGQSPPLERRLEPPDGGRPGASRRATGG